MTDTTEEVPVFHMPDGRRVFGKQNDTADRLRIGWWNDMKRRGVSDDDAYKAIRTAQGGDHD